MIRNQVNVGLMGPSTSYQLPATIYNKNGKHYMHLITMMDPVSCYFEVAAICVKPNSLEYKTILDSVWLLKYH